MEITMVILTTHLKMNPSALWSKRSSNKPGLLGVDTTQKRLSRDHIYYRTMQRFKS